MQKNIEAFVLLTLFNIVTVFFQPALGEVLGTNCVQHLSAYIIVGNHRSCEFRYLKLGHTVVMKCFCFCCCVFFCFIYLYIY